MSADGTVLRQQRDLGQIIEASFNLYFQNLRPFLGIAAVVIPLSIASAVFQSTIDSEALLAAVTIPIVVAQTAVSILAAAALIAALADLEAGQAPDVSRAYDVAFQRFWTLVGAILRSMFHVLLFAITIVGIPWAIQRVVRWLFIEQAVILDHTSARAALSYSADAVEGSWWRTLGIWIVIGLIAAVPAMIITLPFILAPVVISATVNAAVGAALVPFGAIASTLLYLDLKTRKESYVTTSPA